VTHITFELDKMQYAVMQPVKPDIGLAIPPMSRDDIPIALRKTFTQAQYDKALLDFEDRAENHYYAEWFVSLTHHPFSHIITNSHSVVHTLPTSLGQHLESHARQVRVARLPQPHTNLVPMGRRLAGRRHNGQPNLPSHAWEMASRDPGDVWDGESASFRIF
jgi:hypothetical protein